ncbi:MAG: fumarylacetoacetate hydrolase family protein [Desulfosarcina sp.]|nr:fumarylacetoacetate hydrolase family protein [Desulfobacterales bacterium]
MVLKRKRKDRRWLRPWACWGLCLLVFGIGACRPATMKKDAQEPRLFSQTPLPGEYLENDRGDANVILPGRHWMGVVDEGAGLTFASWRITAGTQRYCIVVVCDPPGDRLILLPLNHDETPLTVLADPLRRQYYQQRLATIRQGGPAQNFESGLLISVSLEEAIATKRLGTPLPRPQRVLAVAANFPSHLKQDLAIADPTVIEALRRTRPRVFVKYPPLLPLDGMTPTENITGIIGPFDAIRYPSTISVPARDENGQPVRVATRLDYEVEIGIVIGHELAWEDVAEAADGELYRAVIGYLLISDTKARNPQVVQRIISRERPYPAEPGPYLTGDENIDRRLGFWDRETCRWWSYAAGWGDFAGMGPFLVAAPQNGALPDRMMLAGRSYAREAVRGRPIPPGQAVDTLYLRQSVVVSEEKAYADRMLWTIPRIIRSILAPDNALAFLAAPLTLHPGDIISLGTPGGTVITAKSQTVVNLADALLFWWEPLDWHDAFFGGSEGMYLNPGDEVFFWAEGLGYQRHLIAPLDAHGE